MSQPPPLPPDLPPPTLDYGRPETKERARFGLNWPALIPFAIFVAVHVIVKGRQASGQMKSDAVVPYVIGGILGGLFVSLLIAWISFLPMRSRRAANWGFAIAMALFIVSALASSGPRPRVNVVAVANTQVTSIKALRLSAEQAQQRLVDAGGVDVRPPRDVNEAKERLVLVDQMLAGVRAFIDASDKAGANYAAALKAQGATADEVATSVEKFQQKIQWEKYRPSAAAMEKVAQTGRDVLVFLIDRPGKWELNSAGNDFVLTAGEEAEFVRLRNAFRQAIDESEAIAPATTQPN